VECSAGGTCRFGTCRAATGSEDPDGDLICSLDDNCPVAANTGQEDVDADDEGDACDADEGEIRISRARLRWSRTSTSGNGAVRVWGELRNPLLAGPFPSDEPLAIHVRDGVQVDLAFAIAAADCRRSPSGSILCRSDALGRLRLVLRPESQEGGIERFSLKLRAGGLNLPGPFQPPLALAIVREPPVEVLGVDCYGEVLSCRSTPRGMRCAVP
jgi:hypothetical protein